LVARAYAAPVPRLEFDLATDLRPERVISALIDFTDRRPDLWPSLRREDFRVDEIGGTWAIIREGSGGRVWARERYDWSTPGSVTWTVLDSGFSTPGDLVRANVRANPAGSGSVVHVTWQRRGASLIARLVIALIVLTRGYPVKRSFRRGFAAIAAHDAASAPPTQSTVTS
jgi:hypothetical protein